MTTTIPPYESIRPGDRVAFVQQGKPNWRTVATREEWETAHDTPFGMSHSNTMPVFVQRDDLSLGWISYEGVEHYEPRAYTLCANCEGPVSDVHYLCERCR